MRVILVDAQGLVHAYIANDNAIVLLRDDTKSDLFKVCVKQTTLDDLLKLDRNGKSAEILPPWAVMKIREMRVHSP